ncbi:MAG: ATP synthase F1 subunit delta, partial [Pseudomonadota bacterium]
MAQSSEAQLLAERYAQALFSLAQEEKKLDQVSKELSQLDSCINGSDALQATLKSPIVSRVEMVGVVMALAQKLDLGDISKNLLVLCARNRRLLALQSIIAEFMNILA